MKIIRNERYIQTRSKVGKYGGLAGMGFLVIAMVAWFVGQQNPQLFTVSFVLLLVGFVVSQIAIYYGSRFVRPDQPMEALAKSLKGLDDRYILYYYTSPAPHVLLGPDACYVLTVYWQPGRISARGDRWRQTLGWRRILGWASQEGIDDPTKAAQYEAESLRRYIAKNLSDANATVTPVIVFSHPDVELDVADMTVPVIHAKKLKEWLRGAKGQKLLPETRAGLLKLFGSRK